MSDWPKKETLQIEFKSDPVGGLSDKSVVDAVVGLAKVASFISALMTTGRFPGYARENGEIRKKRRHSSPITPFHRFWSRPIWCRLKKTGGF